MRKILIGRFTSGQKPRFWDMNNVDIKCQDDYAIVQDENNIELVKIIGISAFADDEELGTEKVLMTLSSKDFKTE